MCIRVVHHVEKRGMNELWSDGGSQIHHLEVVWSPREDGECEITKRVYLSYVNGVGARGRPNYLYSGKGRLLRINLAEKYFRYFLHQEFLMQLPHFKYCIYCIFNWKKTKLYTLHLCPLLNHRGE